MRQITKLFLALAIVASPLTFTSCDDDSLYSGNDYYDDLVANAVQKTITGYFLMVQVTLLPIIGS